MKPLIQSLARAATCSIALSLGTIAHGGIFFADFNSGATPSGTALYGDAVIETTGGYTNSGCLKLTKALNNQQGSFVINDLDAGQPVLGFTVTFKALVGGGSAADGFSFNYATDLPTDVFGEEGAGTGLTVEFDSFLNTGGTDTAPSIDVKLFGSEIATMPAPGLRGNTFVDVTIQLRPDGTLLVAYNNVYYYVSLDTSALSHLSAAQFGFGARTGGQNDNHFIDNLSIATQTQAGNAYVDNFSPVNTGVRPDAIVNITLKDDATAVDTNTIVLQFDSAPVTPSISQSTPATTISYAPPAMLASNSTHTVSLTFADNATPTPNTNTFSYSFTVLAYGTLPTNLIAPASLVSTNPGFFIHYSQIDPNLGPTIQRAERQLAGLLIDASTGQPWPNIATPNPNDGTFTQVETNTINYSGFAPGLPGTTGNNFNYAEDVVTYLYLTPGFYTLGVNSSDGFALAAASTPDVFAAQEAQFNGVRAAADTTVSIGVSQAGYYPFRIVHFMGGIEVVNPSAGNPSLQFFSMDATGNKTFVNDTAAAGYIPAFQAAATLPYIRTISPAASQTSVPRNSPIDITLADGSITVQTNTIQLLLDGSAVAAAITANAGITTVHYQPATQFLPNSSHTNQLAFTDNAGSRRTNIWTFTTENILSQLWVITPQQTTNATWQKWITANGTERGLAYNPRTGHTLLVGRNSATGVDGPNGGGIAILDGNTGLYLGQLSLGSGVISGGTFAVNMVDVADDGVIYVCNLATSGAQNFRIYRWQNESATPTVAYSAQPTAAAGTPRWGDAFSVRRSGAGTQIIVSGNNGSANSVPLFTTPDGTNFNLTLLVASGMPNNAVRLGLAWGCGNSFYGETTGSGNPVQYVTFTGPGSTAATRVSTFTIVDPNNVQDIGPIGVNLGNQRLAGDVSNGTPHGMGLYDLDTLATSGNNKPVDFKAYSTSVSSFGTGSADFSPDGTRLYTLDTGNGIIAFTLAPKLAAPTICYNPENFIASASVGFMGVTAVGAPQFYQWRFHGTNSGATGSNISGATNSTLDIYNLQLSNLGFYSVTVTNSMGSVTSTVAYLDTKITITNQPTDQIVALGGSATFNVGVTGGVPALAFQWRQNGANISGATDSAYTINNTQTTDGGLYSVVISDVLGQTTTSSSAGLVVGTAGTGTGLNGDYYSGQLQTFNGPPTLTRIDPTINFDFGIGSPDPSISADQFTVRWTGQVQPFYSQTYTFYTTTDDGVRLWVNGQNVINSWINQAPTERSGTVALTEGQKYPILMEYFENTGGAVAKLSWSSANQFKQIIPQTQLYPGSTPVVPVLASTISNGTNLLLNWSGTFQLESATDVNGPYAAVAGVTNGPYTIPITSSPQMFFRLVNPD